MQLFDGLDRFSTVQNFYSFEHAIYGQPTTVIRFKLDCKTRSITAHLHISQNYFNICDEIQPCLNALFSLNVTGRPSNALLGTS